MARKRYFDLAQLSAIAAAILNCVMARSCPKENYTILTKNGKLCIPCPFCPRGNGLVTPCDTEVYRNAPIDCRLCELGKTFSSNRSKLQCQPCKSTTCHRNEKVDGVCTRTEDSTLCTGTCNNKYYRSNNSAEYCQPCSYCGSTGNAKRVKKCLDDGMPLRMQCENKTDNAIMTKMVTPASTKIVSANISEILPTLNDNRCLSTSNASGIVIMITIIVALVLVIIVLVVIKCPRRRRRCFKVADADSGGSQVVNLVLDVTELEECCTPSIHEEVPVRNDDEQVESNLSENIHHNRDLEDERDLPDVGTPFILEELALRNDDEQPESYYSYNERPQGTTTTRSDRVINSVAATQEPQEMSTQPGAPECVIHLDVFTRSEICKMLNAKLVLGGDYKTFAGLLGMKSIDIETISRKEDPANEVLKHWQVKTSEATIAKLRELLLDEKMGRQDIVDVLDKRGNR